MSGGKQTSETKIPEWLSAAAQQGLGRANNVASIGYTPYYGPDVAAMTPMQDAAMSNINAGASAFGMAAPTSSGMPEAQTFAGGVRGYSSAPMYEAALAELKARYPGQYNAIMSQFTNPVTGAMPMSMQPPAAQPAAPAATSSRSDRSAAEMAALAPSRGYAGGAGTGSFGLPDPMRGRFAGTNLPGMGGQVVNAVTRALATPTKSTFRGGR